MRPLLQAHLAKQFSSFKDQQCEGLQWAANAQVRSKLMKYALDIIHYDMLFGM
jgi:hypothetical protein